MVTATQRDSNGRFLPGCPPGPGRPKRDREAAWQEAFSNALPPDELAAVIAAMLAKAKAGNVSAARLLLEHAVGKPTLKISFDDPEYGFRVAGHTPDQALTRQLELIQRRITEVRSREELIRNGQQGPVPPMPAERPASGQELIAFDDTDLDPTEAKVRGALRYGMVPEAIAKVHNVSERYVRRVAHTNGGNQ